ncbi:MAG: methenyltetrahydrofolate cyclohydrolase, partial [Candidatus Methylophosphatis roskildensis]
GSAAAIMGAMGAALVSMVCNLTIGKKNYLEVEGEMTAVLREAESLRARLTQMIAEDIAAFDMLMAAYALPKATDVQTAARSAAIQAGLEQATEVPLACARVCAEVIDLAHRAAEKGNRNVISDAGVAALAAQAALRSAALNVYINAPGIEDREFAEARVAEIEVLLRDAVARSEAAFAIVMGKL